MKRIRFLLLTLVALLAGINASATKTVYIQPNGWTADNAVISLWIWTDGSDGSWATVTKGAAGMYTATFDDAINRMIVTRGKVGNTWTEGENNMWNKTANINLSTATSDYFYLESVANGINVGSGITNAYKVDFNSTITTSSHDFAVASNWKHIVGSNNYDNYGPYYMSYSYASNEGVDDTGTLRVGAQNGYYMGSTQADADFTDGSYDYLITPSVNGTVTLKVKRYNVTGYPSYVKVFKANAAGTAISDEVATEITPSISDSEWSILTLTLAAETRLAIRAQSVLLDNFTAEEATIVPAPGMTITSVKRADSESTTYFDMNADGSYTVKYKVKVRNTGEATLVAGVTENYSLSVSIDGALYGSFDVPVDLGVGEESEEFLATFVLPSTAPTGWKSRYVAENISNTKYTADEYQWAYSNTLTYNPIPFFIKQGNEPNSKGSSLTGATTLDFGMISSETTENYEIFAHNAGDLTIKSIVAPTGFSVAPAQTLPYTIPAHTGMNVDVTANGVATASGNLVITYVDKNGEDQVANVALSQTYVDPSKWLSTFDDNQWPDNTIHQSSLSINNSDYSNIPYAVTASYSYSNKFFTPLLIATAGEKFRFDARLSSSTGTVKVYVTTDRTTLGDPVLSLSNSQLNSSNFTAQEITIENAGDYYIVFEIYNAYIDNLYGLEKKAVAHDIMVNSYKIGSYEEDKVIQSADNQTFSLEVMPAMAESASNYTVKLMADGEQVATAEAADLVAGTSKTFNFAWAPTVPATKTFETHAEIVFADESKIVSPSLNLTVKCEPVFVFFNAGTAVYGYQPSNRSTAITFGKVNEANLVQNFEIYNYGKADLTVKSVTVPSGFTVTNVTDATVAPATRQAVDITFSASAPGVYEGNLDILYVDKDGVDQHFILAVSGTMLDVSKWYASFDNTTASINWPAGTLYQSSVQNSYHGTYNDHNYHIYSTSATNNMFITRKLSATAGEKFSLDVAPYSAPYDGYVKVYTSTDRETWGEPIENLEITKGASTFTTHSVTMPAGEYYVGLEIYYADVDELYGLTPVAVAHDWKIKSSNIPTEAMQNVAKTATVNILNLGLADEAADSYTVTAYVDGKAAGTGTAVAIPMNHKLSDAGTQLSVNFLSPKAGTFPVYLEVKAGDYSVTTDPVDVNFKVEEAVSDAIEVGSKSGADRYHGPVDWYNNDGSGTNWTDIVYTAQQLQNYGIKAGDKITSIAFKGSGNSKSIKAAITSWVGVKTGDITPGSVDKAAMTEVVVYNQADAAATIDFSLYNIDLTSNPIVWDGTSDIRIYTEAICQGSGNWQTVTYDYDSNYMTSYYKSATAVATPLGYFTLAVEPATLSGTVKTSADAAIAGATVTLKAANGVEYSTTTKASGEYSMNVIQAGLDFTATIEKDGYLKKQFDYSLGGVSKTLDVTLYQQMGIVGTFPGFSWDVDKVMTQDPENPNIFTLEIPDVALEATEYMYKLRADGIWKASSNDGYELPSSGNNSWTVHTAGTYTLKFTADVSAHTLDFELPFTLAEDATGIVDLNWVTITIERDFKAGWNAAILPFNLTAGEITTAFGATAEVAKFLGDEDNGAGSVTVKYTNKTDGISAGVPFLIHLDAPVSNLVFTKDVSATIHPVAGTSFDFTGVYTMTDVNAGDYFIKDGEFKKATTNNKVRPFRAYLKAKVAGVRDINFEIVDGDEVTRIEDVNVVRDFFGEDVYNMNGQKVDNLRKGLYIINGKKVVIK